MGQEATEEPAAGGGDIEYPMEVDLLDARQVSPYAVVFHSDPGQGPGKSDAKVRWYIDGKTRDSYTTPEFVYQFSGAGEYTVTLEVTEGVFGHRSQVTKRIAIDELVAREESVQ